MTKKIINSRNLLGVLGFVSIQIFILVLASCNNSVNDVSHSDNATSGNQGTQEYPFAVDLRAASEFAGQVKATSFYSILLPERGAYDISLYFVANTRLQMSAYDSDDGAQIGISCADYDFPGFDCSIKGVFTLVDGTPEINLDIVNLEPQVTAEVREFRVAVKRVQGELQYDLALNETFSLGFSEQVHSSHYQLTTISNGIHHVLLSAQNLDTNLGVYLNAITSNSSFVAYSSGDRGICEGDPLLGLDCEYYLTSNSKFDITVRRMNIDSHLPIEFRLQVVGP